MDSSSDCAGVLTGWLWDGCGMAVGWLWDTDIFPFPEFQFFTYFGVWSLWHSLAFILCLAYGVFSIPYSGIVFDV